MDRLLKARDSESHLHRVSPIGAALRWYRAIDGSVGIQPVIGQQEQDRFNTIDIFESQVAGCPARVDLPKALAVEAHRLPQRSIHFLAESAVRLELKPVTM